MSGLLFRATCANWEGWSRERLRWPDHRARALEHKLYYMTSFLKAEGQNFRLCTSHCLWAGPMGYKFPDKHTVFLTPQGHSLEKGSCGLRAHTHSSLGFGSAEGRGAETEVFPIVLALPDPPASHIKLTLVCLLTDQIAIGLGCNQRIASTLTGCHLHLIPQLHLDEAVLPSLRSAASVWCRT